jgi:hypothetical protein
MRERCRARCRRAVLSVGVVVGKAANDEMGDLPIVGVSDAVERIEIALQALWRRRDGATTSSGATIGSSTLTSPRNARRRLARMALHSWARASSRRCAWREPESVLSVCEAARQSRSSAARSGAMKRSPRGSHGLPRQVRDACQRSPRARRIAGANGCRPSGIRLGKRRRSSEARARATVSRARPAKPGETR